MDWAHERQQIWASSLKLQPMFFQWFLEHKFPSVSQHISVKRPLRNEQRNYTSRWRNTSCKVLRFSLLVSPPQLTFAKCQSLILNNHPNVSKRYVEGTKATVKPLAFEWTSCAYSPPFRVCNSVKERLYWITLSCFRSLFQRL